jgi:GcrA cell cycle regulator
MSWTDQDTERAVMLRRRGLSANQIARALGDKTRNAVLGKLHRLGDLTHAGDRRLDALTRAMTAAMLSRRWRRRNAPAAMLIEEDAA